MELDNKFLDLIFNELFHDGNFRLVKNQSHIPLLCLAVR